MVWRLLARGGRRLLLFMSRNNEGRAQTQAYIFVLNLKAEKSKREENCDLLIQLPCTEECEVTTCEGEALTCYQGNCVVKESLLYRRHLLGNTR